MAEKSKAKEAECEEADNLVLRLEVDSDDAEFGNQKILYVFFLKLCQDIC